jgi:hypothetical protein
MRGLLLVQLGSGEAGSRRIGRAARVVAPQQQRQGRSVEWAESGGLMFGLGEAGFRRRGSTVREVVPLRRQGRIVEWGSGESPFGSGEADSQRKGRTARGVVPQRKRGQGRVVEGLPFGSGEAGS